MDPVTLVGLLAVALMFTSGVVLLWIGLHRRTVRLPKGADAVLAAVAEGRLATRPRTTAPVTEPLMDAGPLLAAIPAPVPAPLVTAEERPAVRLIPRTPTPAHEPAPAARPATAAQLVAVARSAPASNPRPDERLASDLLPSRPASRTGACDERPEDEKVAVGVAALEEFFAREPQLHRF